MSTEYSLLTCLGRDGQTVTLTIASPCVVTLNAHGMPDGHPIRFTTTGALPTGLAINTTYYVKSPTANAFNVSATNGGAAINTSGSQSGTHRAIGEYWATLPATDPGNGGNYRARYGTAGSERVYANLQALNTAKRSPPTSATWAIPTIISRSQPPPPTSTTMPGQPVSAP